MIVRMNSKVHTSLVFSPTKLSPIPFPSILIKASSSFVGTLNSLTPDLFALWSLHSLAGSCQILPKE